MLGTFRDHLIWILDGYGESDMRGGDLLAFEDLYQVSINDLFDVV